MIDLHTHIINNVDDGSASLDISLELISKEIELGVTDIICTPHYRKFMFETNVEDVKLSFFNLKEAVKKNNLNINLYLGQEIFVRSIEEFRDILKFLDNKEILTFENSKYILLEFSYTNYIDITEIVYMACNRGYKPIIAHIERYQYLDMDEVEEIIKAGALIQVNASSIIGIDGRKTKKFINKIIKNGFVDFVSSDIHDSRVNYLKLAYNYVFKKHGIDVCDRIFKNNAKDIIESFDLRED